MKQHYENEIAAFDILNGIFRITMKPKTILDQHTAQVLTNVRLGMQQNRHLPALYLVDGFIDSDKNGRDYLAKHAALMAPAVAICAKGHVQKAIASFIISVSKPTVPCGVFSTEDTALEFLKRPQ